MSQHGGTCTKLVSMDYKLSRRQFASRAAVAATGLTLGKFAIPQDAKPIEVTDQEAGVIESGLGAPLSDEAKSILKSTLKSNRDGIAARMKFKLPENSEPCTVYVPTNEGQK